MLFKKKDKIQGLMRKHAEKVAQGVNCLREAVGFYLEGDKKGFEERVLLTRKIETEADKIKREAELELYQGGHLPIFREDFLSLMELIDDVADEAEKVTDFLSLESPEIPSPWKEKFRKITEDSCLAFSTFLESFLLLYEDMEKAFTFTHKVEDEEKKVDRLQDELIREVFKSRLDLAQKIHLRDLIIKIGLISDSSENASDKVGAMALKRKI